MSPVGRGCIRAAVNVQATMNLCPLRAGRTDQHSDLLLISLHWRYVRNAGEDGVHFLPVHAGGAFGDGGAVWAVVDLRVESGEDQGIHGNVLASRKFADAFGEAAGELDFECHGMGNIEAIHEAARLRCRWRGPERGLADCG